MDFPKLSIVTPSYNQAQYLEQTILSVINQNYPNFEYMIIDGGSTDNSVEIIKKYEKYLTFWVSESDKGQSDALLKGFLKSTGEILAWINSDDYYLPGSFSKVAKIFAKNKDVSLVQGSCDYVSEKGKLIYKNYGMLQDYDNLLTVGMFSAQPSMFWKREAYLNVGGLNRDLHYCMDYDLVLKITKQHKVFLSRRSFSAYRTHPNAKSQTIEEVLEKENILIGELYGRYNKKLEIINQEKITTWEKYNKLQMLLFFTEILFAPLYFLRFSLNFLLKCIGVK